MTDDAADGTAKEGGGVFYCFAFPPSFLHGLAYWVADPD
jgi:hypothetical protein